MAGLLVSVRDAEEARVAWRAGASIIDVKEPSRGPLGRPDALSVRSIRHALPAAAPMSQALGELADWDDRPAQESWVEGVSLLKLGLAGAGPDWPARWRAIVDAQAGSADWVAVIYADWALAHAPGPSAIVQEAGRFGCRGVLIDTWSKSLPSPVAPSGPWVDIVREARSLGLFVALAGGLDCRAILRLESLQPDIFAVRGAACEHGNRLGPIVGKRVESLARLVAPLGPSWSPGDYATSPKRHGQENQRQPRQRPGDQ